MGLMNSALQIGRSALLGYQSALQVVGNNISSSGNTDYTRLTPDLSSVAGPVGADGMQPGAGVTLSGIQRQIDEALEGRVRLSIGDVESLDEIRSTIAQVEAYFDDVSGSGISNQLTTFFNGFDAVRNDPEDLATRELAINNGVQLATDMSTLREQLLRLGRDTDDRICDEVERADELATQIGALNEEVMSAEAGAGSQAAGLRDQRDALLRDLAEIVDVTVREEANGSINVYLGSEALIQGANVRGLTAQTSVEDDFQRTTIRFADTGGEVAVRGGRLEGLIASRDTHAYGRVAAVNELAAGVIYEVNLLHADGQGLTSFTEVTADRRVLETDVPLNSAAAGLPFVPDNGSFYLTVSDLVSETPIAYRIDVNLAGDENDTTLDSLVEDINTNVTGVTASLDDQRLVLSADHGYSFSFGHDGALQQEDTSGVLAALGINTFFTGTDASDIAVREELQSDAMLLAASSTLLSGDGENAGRIAALDSTTSAMLGEITISEFYAGVAHELAAAGSAAQGGYEAASAVRDALQVQRESVSGVNLDEEAISLLQYQRAFQGAARFVSVVDQLLQETMALLT
jgi:flagellar hook-associated protein 1 FlgK